MICSKCNTQNADENKFCLSCGSVLEAAAEETKTDAAEAVQQTPADETPAQEKSGTTEQLKKITGNKKLIGIVAAVLAVVIIAGIVIASTSGTDSVRKGYFSSIYDSNTKECTIVYGGEIIEKGVVGNDYFDEGYAPEGYVSPRNSLSGEVAVYIDSEKTLRAVTEDGSQKLAENVSSVKTISDDGERVIYTDVDGATIVYDIDSGEKKTITEENVYNAAFSPDGKSIVYSTFVYPEISDEETTEYENTSPEITGTGYVFINNESKKVIDNGYAWWLSDGAEYIYCMKEDSETKEEVLYVTNLDGDRKKIASGVNGFSDINSDCTQIIFQSDSKWYVSVKGGEKIRIEGVSSSIERLYAINNEKFQGNIMVGYSYSEGKLEYSIYKLDKKWSAEKLAGGIENYRVSDDGEIIYYTKNDKLYILGEDESIEEEVAIFEITHDGSAVYYVTEDETLYYKKGTGERKRVADDVTEIHITHDDYALFKNEDGTLYSSKNGKSPETICDDVTKVYTCVDYTYFYGDVESHKNKETGDTVHECNVYMASKKADFDKILSDIAY